MPKTPRPYGLHAHAEEENTCGHPDIVDRNRRRSDGRKVERGAFSNWTHDRHLLGHGCEVDDNASQARRRVPTDPAFHRAVGRRFNACHASAHGGEAHEQSQPKNTGGMHGILPVHWGMHVRLLEALSINDGLVKDAEGEIVEVVVNPLDQDLVDDARASGSRLIYLRHLPLGFWVLMSKYRSAPFVSHLQDFDDGLIDSNTRSLVFIEPRTSDAFNFRDFRVTRTGFALSHARVITATACQGRTMHAGVIIDAGRHEIGETRKEDDDWWLDLYVMLSRATRLEDLVVIRAPPADFLLRGPPATLKSQLQKLATRVTGCRKDAAKVARELGFGQFFHEI